MTSASIAFTEPRAEGADVTFEARRGDRTWRFRVTADALAVTRQGIEAPDDEDPLATYARASEWLETLACRFVDEGHAHKDEIVMDAAYLATASDR